jgi:hypothetical protein
MAAFVPSHQVIDEDCDGKDCDGKERLLTCPAKVTTSSSRKGRLSGGNKQQSGTKARVADARL